MLAELLRSQRGLASSIARDANVSRPYVWQIASGARPTPPACCPAIERATDGRVTVDQLRPDVRWARIADPTWPHPGGRPTIDVAGPAAAEVE